MKFDFSNTKYVQSFENSVEGRTVIQYLLNDPDYIRANYDIWRTFFPVDPNTITTANDGTAAIKVFAEEPDHATIADMRAPLGKGRLGEEGQKSWYLTTFADMIAPSWQEQAKEREAKERLFAEFGSEAPILAGYATKILQPRVDSINMALSNLAMQALSTGKAIYNFGKGIKAPLYSAPIPDENKVNAGAKVWSDPDCELLTQIVKIAKHFKEDVWGRESMALELDVTYDQFQNVFLKNKEVIDTIKVNWLASNGQLISQTDAVPTSLISEESFNKYVNGVFPELPYIRVVAEHQKDGDTLIHGWKDGVAVLRPLGIAGHTYRSEILDKYMDEKYGNNIITSVYGSTLDGIITVINTTGINGKYKYWATDVVACAAPALESYIYQVLIDTTTATAE
jgi:hypothetical protein